MCWYIAFICAVVVFWVVVAEAKHRHNKKKFREWKNGSVSKWTH